MSFSWGWPGADNPQRRRDAVRLANAAGLDGVGSFSLYERRMNRLDSRGPDSDVTQVRPGPGEDRSSENPAPDAGGTCTVDR